MGTFLKYLLYLLILIAVYIIVTGFYDGSINSSTTMGEVASQVGNGTRDIARDTANGIEQVVDDATKPRSNP